MLEKGKKIIFGIIIVIVGFFGIGIAAVSIYQYTDPEGYAKMQEEQEQKEIEERKQEQQEKALPTTVTQIIPSKMGNGYWQSDAEEAYYDHSEKLLSEYVLSYKGKDNAGLDIQNAMLLALTDKCGADVLLEKSNTETWVSISDWDDKKIRVTMLTSSDNTCANTQQTFNFDIYPQTGKIISHFSQGGTEKLLNLLDST